MQDILKTYRFTGGEKKIFLLRHGEVHAETDQKRFIGQLDLPLSDLGRHQARCWRKSLADTPITHIISSDLSRCMETARIVAADRSMEVTPLAALREIHLGRWDGMAFREVKNRWPEAFQKRGVDMSRFRPPAGESFQDLQQRVVPVFEKAVAQAGKHILIVAHAGVNRMILCYLLGMPVENLFRIAQGCGAMNLIERKAGEYRIASINLLPDQRGEGQ